MAQSDKTGAAELLRAGYDSARAMFGDSYAAYLEDHDQELFSKGRAPCPWPKSLQGNDGE